MRGDGGAPRAWVVSQPAGRQKEEAAGHSAGAHSTASTIRAWQRAGRCAASRMESTTPKLSGAGRRVASAISVSGHSGRYILSHRKLLFRVTRNELAGRYAGSLLGLGWLVASPMIVLSIYAVVYLYIFRFSPTGLTEAQYALYIIAGLVVYLLTAEALSFGVSSVVANRALISNVVFPIDLVPVKAVLMAQPTMVVGTIAAIVTAVVVDTLSWWTLLVPVVWILQTLALVGAAWILSLLNVVLRDLTHAIAILLIILLIASPIAYTPEMVPDRLSILLAINPFAYYVVVYQELIVLGQSPTVVQIVGILLVSGVLFGVGGWFFARAKRALLDYV